MMSLVRKYDKTLRRKFALRAVWTPGTRVRVGDIMVLKNSALVSVGNISDEQISFTEKSIADAHSLRINSNGVSQTLLQNGAKISLSRLDPETDAELRISFNSEDSYLLRTPKLTGVGMEQSLHIARQVAKLPHWDFQKYYVVHKVWFAEEFTFLGTLEKNRTLEFKGKGVVIKKLITSGISIEQLASSGCKLSYDVTGISGPVVMQVFRVKKDGDIY